MENSCCLLCRILNLATSRCWCCLPFIDTIIYDHVKLWNYEHVPRERPRGRTVAGVLFAKSTKMATGQPRPQKWNMDRTWGGQWVRRTKREWREREHLARAVLRRRIPEGRNQGPGTIHSDIEGITGMARHGVGAVQSTAGRFHVYAQKWLFIAENCNAFFWPHHHQQQQHPIQWH